MTSANPARLFGLYPRKGSLIPGADADLVIVDPEPQFTLRADDLQYRNRHSVYVGQSFQGVVHTTLVRGTPVYSAAGVVGQTGYGQWVKPSILDITMEEL
jgi:allantoinase